jgi:hypothetical protein
MRDVPDVALNSAGHDGYLVTMNGGNYVFSGTSAAAPSFAGLMALVAQSSGSRQGNVNPTLYRLAARQQAGTGAAVFHDAFTGSNSVPGVTGYSAASGYDLVTGLGSVDALALVIHWNDATTVPALNLTASPASISVIAGGNSLESVTTTVSGGFSSSVRLSMSGLPFGLSALFTPISIPAPGAGTSTLRLTASSTVVPGTYSATLKAVSAGYTKSIPLAVVVLPAPSFTLAGSPTHVSILNGTSGSVQVTVAANSTFSAPVTLTASGLPAGMTISFTPASFSSPGSGASRLLVSAASTVAPGSYTLTVKAVGGGVTRSTTVTIGVPSFTLSLRAANATFPAGGSGSIGFSTAVLGGFSSAVNFSISGLPSGVTATLVPIAAGAPGTCSGSILLAAAPTASIGTKTVTFTATGGGVSRSASFSLVVTQPSVTFTHANAPLIVPPGSSRSLTITTAGLPSFLSMVTFKATGMPAGMTAAFVPATIASPGLGTSTLTISAATTVSPGNYAITVLASGTKIAWSTLFVVTVQ